MEKASHWRHDLEEFISLPCSLLVLLPDCHVTSSFSSVMPHCSPDLESANCGLEMDAAESKQTKPSTSTLDYSYETWFLDKKIEQHK